MTENETVLEILQILYEKNGDYKAAFHILMKMNSRKIFDFLNKVKLDIDLP